MWHGFRIVRVCAKQSFFMYRIMIVADEPFLRDMVRYALAGLDVEFRCPPNVEEARKLGGRILFDLIIVLTITPFACCCSMPRVEGFRRPVVYVIAWQQSEQTVLSLLESGVDQYMTFPVNLQRLRSKVTDELNRIRA